MPEAHAYGLINDGLILSRKLLGFIEQTKQIEILSDFLPLQNRMYSESSFSAHMPKACIRVGAGSSCISHALMKRG